MTKCNDKTKLLRTMAANISSGIAAKCRYIVNSKLTEDGALWLTMCYDPSLLAELGELAGDRDISFDGVELGYLLRQYRNNWSYKMR